MPISKVDLTGSDKHFEQSCVRCGYKQRIRLGYGAQATKEAPFALSAGATVIVSVDGGADQTVSFAAASFKNVGAATAQELVVALNAQLTGATASLDASPDCVVIESTTPGSASCVRFTGGTALTALGLYATAPEDRIGVAPVVGCVADGVHLKNNLQLRPCNGCGINGALLTQETLMRAWDTAPDAPEYKHRRVVNALFQWMKDNGHVNDLLLLDYAEESQVPPDTLADIDKSVIEIPMP
jgi:hypothetical protein